MIRVRAVGASCQGIPAMCAKARRAGKHDRQLSSPPIEPHWSRAHGPAFASVGASGWRTSLGAGSVTRLGSRERAQVEHQENRRKELFFNVHLMLDNRQ
jgi:hypothetical protein